MVEASITMVKKRAQDEHRSQAVVNAERVILELFGATQQGDSAPSQEKEAGTEGTSGEEGGGGSKGEEEEEEGDLWLQALRRGDLDDKEVEVDVTPPVPDAGKEGNQNAAAVMMR